MRVSRAVPIAIALGALAAGQGAAQPTPLDPDEFQVNTYTTGLQQLPAVAVAPEGSFVVVWESVGSAGNDSSGWSIQARRFATDGTALDAADLQVNTYTTDFQRRPDVAMDLEGNFVVVWMSYGSGGDDTSNWSIQARRFAADGSPLDPAEFQINTYTTSSQESPKVVVDPEGSFVVVWNSLGSLGTDTDLWSIQARRFAGDGSPEDPTEFQVNTYTTGIQQSPDVAVDALGFFVVVWGSGGSFGTDSSAWSVQARRFGDSGAPQDPNDFQVNTYTTDQQGSPAVAKDAEGAFVVSWVSAGSAGSDTSEASVQARRFGANGLPWDANDFQVNTYTTNSQSTPTVAVDPEGNFSVAWESWGSAGFDPSDFSIQTRRFRNDGGAIDAADYQANTLVAGAQFHSAAAIAPSGEIVLAWDSAVSAGGDSNSQSIQVRRFGLPTIPVTSTSGGTGGPDCKLRDAVTAANTDAATGGCGAGSGGAVIALPAGATISLTTEDNPGNGLPIVEQPITIRGNGATIARSGGCPGASEFRHFQVADGTILTLEEVTLEGGCLSADEGGAILGAGGLVLREARIQNNTASGVAGGLYALGPFFAFDSTVAGNSSGATGGGLAIHDFSPLAWIERSTFSGNSADSGGGIASDGSTFLVQSTVSGNSAVSAGGGVFVGSGVLFPFWTTVTDNAAPSGAGIFDSGWTLFLRSLVGDNTGPDCAGGPFFAYGENLDTDGSCAALAGSNFTTVAALGLGPLAANGGPTWIHLPLNGSPARDAATACETGSTAPIVEDQRGLPRPTDDDMSDTFECDLGAVEVNTVFADGFELGDWSRWSAAVP